ncbi:hypothetical protein GOM44_04065 [Wolbachia endosymbiont of Atemnus politus]|uniref:hypothetical protein n=1 Tax=Wolbachia endosymbiont of Atemnus politus TaxID=2682840 RepID=UPI0019DEA8D9|nr:hypothetical protein [Wolbachia endosymbiont of Atemnus politus]
MLFAGCRSQKELTINNSSDFVNDLAKIANLSFLAYLVPSEKIKILSNINLNENEFTAMT